MRHAVVINAASGTALKTADVEELVRVAFEEAGLDAVFIHAPDGMDSSKALIWRLEKAKEDGDVVVVGGGDGSIAAAAGVMCGTGKPLGIIPLGTANLVARDLSIPLDLDEAIVALVDGVPREIDVGDVNGRLFLCNAVMGFSSVLARTRERDRRKASLRVWFNLAWNTLRGLSRLRPLRAVISTGGRTARVRTHAIVVSNNPYDEEAGRFMARARLDNGVLGLYVLERSSIITLFRLVLGMNLGDWRKGKGLAVHTARQVSVRAPRRHINVMIDGEVALMKTPLRFRIRPCHLTVVLPKPPEAVPEGA